MEMRRFYLTGKFVTTQDSVNFVKLKILKKGGTYFRNT